ncbi:MAG: M28 family peptidase [Proteobacteria bacterium]|nr:MAG: M28 family peptidase [Pseudomonadota bacterium]
MIQRNLRRLFLFGVLIVANSALATSPIETRLRADVQTLAHGAQPRSSQNAAGLKLAADHVKKEFESAGFKVSEQEFKVGQTTFKNLLTSYGPEKGPRIVVGAHYDVAGPFPGADDNASGVAGLLEIARMFQQNKPQIPYRIDLVAYTLEEPPFFATNDMGSAHHARMLKKEKVEVKLMISLEMIGYFSDQPHSQEFPVSAMKLIYPTTGNFIAVVGDMGTIKLVRNVKNVMKQNSEIDVQALNAPRDISGISFSDHRNFWEQGYPAIMITDTAFFRNPNYHTKDDTADSLNYKRMAEVVKGVFAAITQIGK